MAIEADVEADAAKVVRSSVTVKLPRDAAFRLFTERMDSWWPLATHSVFHAEAVAVTIEPVVGGRVYEATADGRSSDWGTITEWQPGKRLAMTWHPGDESDLATLVEVTFSEAPDGGNAGRSAPYRLGGAWPRGSGEGRRVSAGMGGSAQGVRERRLSAAGRPEQDARRRSAH